LRQEDEENEVRAGGGGVNAGKAGEDERMRAVMRKEERSTGTLGEGPNRRSMLRGGGEGGPPLVFWEGVA